MKVIGKIIKKKEGVYCIIIMVKKKKGFGRMISSKIVKYYYNLSKYILYAFVKLYSLLNFNLFIFIKYFIIIPYLINEFF